MIANIAICLIHQINYLLNRQLKTLEKEFIGQGGLCERMKRDLQHIEQKAEESKADDESPHSEIFPTTREVPTGFVPQPRLRLYGRSAPKYRLLTCGQAKAAALPAENEVPVHIDYC